MNRTRTPIDQRSAGRQGNRTVEAVVNGSGTSVTENRGPASRVGAFAIASAIALGGLLGVAGSAQAAKFGVRVLDDGGQPVPGASVCIGLEGNYRQFGTAFTDLEGRAELVEVPNMPFVVTVSKTRFTGTRLSQPAHGYDLVRDVVLAEGLPGPRCKAGSSMAANPPVIDVRGVDVLDDDAATTLRPSVSGAPSEYRLAADDSFEGAAWQRFERSIAVPDSLSGERAVFLQLRRLEGSSRSWLEARSDVVTIELPRRDR